MAGNIRKQISHDWNVICDVCGKKKKRSQITMAYGIGDIPVIASCKDGCADYRHPLNSPPPVIFDGQPVPDARPDQGNNQETYVFLIYPSYMSWGHLSHSGTWGEFNNLNTEFNYGQIWSWGAFTRNN